MSVTWKILHLDDSSIPQLLIKARLDSSGYTIHLTDFSRIWSETLTKREIKRRAISDDCSIDPSEGDDQYQILLENIRQALDKQDGTSLTLHPTQEQDEILFLSLSAPLPSPLPPLKWQTHLSLLPPSSIEHSLVRPLLHHAQHLQSQIQQLFQELSDKDRIISKITDRLETSGNDLTTVFPGTSNVKVSRKKSQREQLARHVRGLGDFDEGGWRVRDVGLDGRGRLGLGDLDRILRDLVEDVGEGGEDDGLGEWWRVLGEGTGSRVDGDGRNQRRSQVRDKVGDEAVHAPAESDGDITMDDEDELDEEFQRQGTPPYLKPNGHNPQHHVSQDHPATQSKQNEPQPHILADDESTEDDADDLDASPRKSIHSQHSGSTAQTRNRTAMPDTAASSPRKLGTIGGRRAASFPTQTASPEEDRAPPPPPKARGYLGAIGGKSKALATPEPAPEHGVSTAKPRAKLGTIGGRSKASAPSPGPAPDSLAATPAAAPSPAKPAHKLGVCRKPKIDSDAVAPSTRQPSEAASTASEKERPLARLSLARESGSGTAKEPTPPRETSRERADRKREELKRSLEEKAKGPGKKRMKF